MNDWERYLEKREYTEKLVRKIFYCGIFCILLLMITVKSIALIPKAEPNYEVSDCHSYEYQGTDENAIYITSDGASADSIRIESTVGGMVISCSGTTWDDIGDADEPGSTIKDE